MKFLYAEEIAEEICLSFLLPLHREDPELFTQTYSRIAAGLSWEEPLLAVVIGEQVLSSGKGMPLYRRYFVLAEATAGERTSFMGELIRLKDIYCIRQLFVPLHPAVLNEELRRMDGLTHYRTTNPYAARAFWPTFRHKEHVAGVRMLDLPDLDEMHREIEAALEQPLVEDTTGLPYSGADGQPLTTLALPEDLPIQQTHAGIRRAATAATQALWLALTGLQRSVAPLWHVQQEAQELKRNPITGY